MLKKCSEDFSRPCDHSRRPRTWSLRDLLAVKTLWGRYASVYEKLMDVVPYREHRGSLLSEIGFDRNGFYADLGSGTGPMLENRTNLIGLDLTPEMLASARKRNPRSPLVLCDLNEGLPFRDGALEGAISNNVLAYLASPESFMAEVSRILRPDALLVVATLRPSFSPLAILFDHVKKTSWPGFFRNLHFALALILFNLPIVLRLRSGTYHGYEVSELERLLRRHDFRIVKSSHSYAQQDVLVVARKRRAAGTR